MSFRPDIPKTTRNIETGYTTQVSEGELVTVPAFTINSGTTFNGTDERVSSDTSVSSNWGTTLTYSMWVNVHSLPGTSTFYNEVFVRQFESEWCSVEKLSGEFGKLYLRFYDVVGLSVIKEFRSTNTVFSSALNTWHHVLVSLDTSSTNCYVYFNGSLLAGTWLTNSVAGLNLGTGSSSSGSAMVMAQHSTHYANVSIAEFWASKEAIDITNATNRERFRDASGNAVYLGTDGSLASPTSTQPELFYNDAATTASTANAGSYTVDWNPLNSPTESATLPPHTSTETKTYTPDLTETSIKYMDISDDFTLEDPALGATKGGSCEVYLNSDGNYTITAGTGVTIAGSNTITPATYLLEITSFGVGKTVATITFVPDPPGNLYIETVLADSPIAYWRMDEGTGTNLVDSIAARDATLTGGSWTTTCLVNDHESEDAVYLSNIDTGKVTVPYDSGDPAFTNLFGLAGSGKDCTIEFIYAGFGSSEILFSTLSSGGWSIAAVNPRTFRFAWETTGITYTSTGGNSYSPLPPNNTCWHVAFRFNANKRSDSSYVNWIINGIPDDPPSISVGSGTLTSDSGNDLIMGQNHSGTQQLNGKLMHVAIYDKLLTDSEICNHFLASGISDPPGGPGGCP